MKNKKIIFMGTPLIAANYLVALLKNNINIHAVYSQPPRKQLRGMKIMKSEVHKIAEKEKIDVFCPINFDNEAINEIKKLKPDLIIVMAYGKLLPKVILEMPKYGCINIHLSLLPRWRGASPVEHALINGDRESGVSIIKLVEKLDAGPIIAQEKISIPDKFNKLQLINKLNALGIKLLIEVLKFIFNDNVNLVHQDHSLATYATKINVENRKIIFNNLAIDIINLIRSHAPHPGAWFFLNKERIKILDAKIGTSIGETSTILNNKFEIGCKDGSIEPLILQREGRSFVKKEDFIRGFKFNIYDKINE